MILHPKKFYPTIIKIDLSSFPSQCPFFASNKSLPKIIPRTVLKGISLSSIQFPFNLNLILRMRRATRNFSLVLFPHVRFNHFLNRPSLLQFMIDFTFSDENYPHKYHSHTILYSYIYTLNWGNRLWVLLIRKSQICLIFVVDLSWQKTIFESEACVKWERKSAMKEEKRKWECGKCKKGNPLYQRFWLDRSIKFLRMLLSFNVWFIYESLM